MAALPTELTSLAALRSFLEIGDGEAKFLARYAGYRYRQVLIPKRRGGARILLVPDKRLKFLQRKLLEILEPQYTPRAAVHGFVKAKSAISNANAHQARPYLLNLDLENFFGSITPNRVGGMLRAIGIPPDVAQTICAICTANNQLPQGAPTSPLLANMVCFRLDRELTTFAKVHRLRYTRYADDISFSSYVKPTALFAEDLAVSGRVPLEKLSTDIRALIGGNSFAINPGKTWFSDSKARKEVTGLIVNEFTNVRRTFVRNLRAGLYKTEILGVEIAEIDFKARHRNKGTLQEMFKGRLEWLAQVRGRSFGAYRTLAARYNKLFPDSKISIDPTYDEIAVESVFILEYLHDEDQTQGTAFFLDGVGLVTAHHNLEKMPISWATLYRPHKPTLRYMAKFSGKTCKHRDLAILEHNVPPEEQTFLKPATASERTKTPITALGFPDFGPGDSLAERPGHIVGRATKGGVKLIEVSSILSDGLSGGPIVNDRNEVLAIIHKGGPLENKQLGIDISEVVKLASE